MNLKNTNVTGITELVIDGRTKQIQWKKYSNDLWYRDDFRNIDLENTVILNMFYDDYQRVETLSHNAIVKRMKSYDKNQRKYKTWISGYTFNVKVRK